MAIVLTAIDGLTLNNVEGTVIHIVRSTSSNAYTVTTTSRARNRLTPVLSDERFNTRKRTFSVTPNHEIIATNDPDEVEEFNLFVHQLFMPWDGERTLSGQDELGEDWTAAVRITRFGRIGPHEWEGEFEFLTGVWKSVTLSEETTSPITVTGNVFAQPIITIEGGTAITRNRVTIKDRTGHGIMGLMVGITGAGSSTEDENIVYINGVEVPFSVVSGTMFFRVAAPPNGTTFVDIFYGSAITNITTAGQLDAAGIDLNSDIVSFLYASDPEDPFSHALPSSLSWHPGVVTRHPQNRSYTYGFDGANLVRLVDRTASGQQYNLADDADSYIITSPVEMVSIENLQFDVEVGYLAGRNDPSANPEDTPVRTLRVIIATADGQALTTGPVWGSSNTHGNSTMSAYPAARNQYTFYAQWTFDGITFPNTYSFETLDNQFITGGFQGTIWRNDYLPWEFATVAQDFFGSGVTITTGDPGVYYVHFPAGSFSNAIDIPELSMSIQPKPGAWTTPTGGGGLGDEEGEVTQFGDASLNDLLLFETEWVDPVTLQPLSQATADGPINDESLAGTTTAFVAYRTRDSEDWIVAWEETVTGVYPDGATDSFSVDISDLQAVQIAVGLKPSSTRTNTIEWGSLTITSDPEIQLDSSKAPLITQNDGLSADLMQGTLLNQTTGKSITLEGVVGDGLVIDTENLTIKAVTGPFYGRIKNNGGTRMFDLKVGENIWISPHVSGTVTFEWRERQAS